MLVDATVNRHCVIWFGVPAPVERQLLAASGWSLRVVDMPTQAGPGLRAGDLVVGLLDLRGETLAQLDMVLDWTDRQAPHRLFALVADATPVEDPRVATLLQRCQRVFAMPLDASAFCAALNEATSLGKDARASDPLDEMIGQSCAMLQVKASLRRFGPIDLPVLVTGDTGTGKEVAARALHALSPRRGKPFAAINCGALPTSLVQSELFGHERGAFTGANTRRAGLFESADGGTVFLDEIGDLPLEAQTNLLRVLQEGTIERLGSHQPVKVDVRVVAATHVDLEQAVAQGRFREDLYYRLNVLRLRMPCLRERGEDIQRLARHFLERFRERHKVRAHGFNAQALQAMAVFDWPGNVRELLNRVQRAAIVADASLITPRDLELEGMHPPDSAGLVDARAQAERETLLEALRRCNWNVSACARHMRVSRVTIYRLCRKHQVALDAAR